MTEELAQHQITQLLREYGDDINEGQPEQVAGRWVEHGFEDPDEVRRFIEAGITAPEDASGRVEQNREPSVESPDRHDDPAGHGRDVVRGTTYSRSRPGDEREHELQPPGAPP